ncbi:aminotransferase class V-fold PLP-dependent enzyme [Aquibacillus halophilus]|uniref:cysteine desulfurase n=1 Tax=Aquibacillus halophilus TaxID=930132 RepID=A0A6A8DBE4_9BACI|nr:cysteine desulfurase family protein [Aquibacillus halophilus]MRH43023.1 aminotransferase class V-fold PLP-dependent enzyme [Aquibacillus halophilus]
MNPIYLDHAATTPIHPEVIQAMVPVFEEVYGNPSSVHHFGRKARQIIDEARRVIALSINANDKEITFTSGGTEADNIALIGTALANKSKGNHIITTKMEHHATLHAAEYLEKHGFSVSYLDVMENGQVDISQLVTVLTDETILVSIMTVNNETGVIQPIREIGEILKDHQAYFHTDAVQAYGMLELDVEALGVDLLTASSHKINGPKGVGFLFIKNSVKVESLQYGGQQERKRRPGTENVAGIRGFQAAVELVANDREQRLTLYQEYKTFFLQILEKEDVEFSINGDIKNTVASIINISFPGTNVEALLTNFDLSGIAASSGSACTAGSVEPSHVLSAMYGSSNQTTVNSIRFSFGLANTKENIEEAAKKVATIVKRLAIN